MIEDVPSGALVKLENAAKTNAIPGRAGEIVRTPGRFLVAADQFFKSMNYSGELYAQAYRQAVIDSKAGKGNITDLTSNYIKNPTKPMTDAAHYEAHYRTFNQPYGKWGAKVAALRETVPGARYIVPFLRTPMNVAKFGLERTPLNFLRLAEKAFQDKTLRGAKLADELAKPILGASIAAAIVPYVLDGHITGGGPKDTASRDELLNSGWQSYSIKIGDKYIPFSRLEPLGSIMGMMTDFTLMVDNKDHKQASEMAGAAAASIAKNLTSKTFLQGVSNALDAMSDPERYGEHFMEALAGTLVPGFVNTAAKEVDPIRRLASTPSEAIQAKIPWSSDNLPPKRNVWGQEVEKTGNALERTLSPSPITKESDDPVKLEVARLQLGLGMPAKDFRGMRMDNQQYDQYTKRAGELAYGMVSEALKSDMTDNDKRLVIPMLVQKARTIAGVEIFPEAPAPRTVREIKQERGTKHLNLSDVLGK
jgi:hypothetical protein